MSQLDQIEHFIVLMLENRSFDCLLGKLYPPSADFDGLTGTEFEYGYSAQCNRRVEFVRYGRDHYEHPDAGPW